MAEYDNHSPDKIVFRPPPDLLPAWEADYKQMRENMIFGEALGFEDLIQALMVLQFKLNKMIVKQ